MKAKPQSEEYRRFEALLGQVLTVSKEELNRRLEAENREKRTPKRRASRASAEASTER
jgi:ribose 1,5-bisphosphokinase PhnN